MPVGHSGREPVARRLGGGELFISLLKTLGRNPQLPFPLSYLSHNFRVLLGPGASMEAPVLVPALAGLQPGLAFLPCFCDSYIKLSTMLF